MVFWDNGVFSIFLTRKHDFHTYCVHQGIVPKDKRHVGIYTARSTGENNSGKWTPLSVDLY